MAVLAGLVGQELRQIRGKVERRWVALFGSDGASFFNREVVIGTFFRPFDFL